MQKARSRLRTRRNHSKAILNGIVLSLAMLIGGLLSAVLTSTELDDSRIVEPEARASEVKIEYRYIESQEQTEKQEIMSYIIEVFGDNADKAIQIAKCESGLIPDNVGDTNLMTIRDGEIVGDSVGIFQIRTGGDDFNRAKANGMTAAEFRERLKDWKYNVDYAKQIFDRSGWKPWSCNK